MDKKITVIMTDELPYHKSLLDISDSAISFQMDRFTIQHLMEHHDTVVRLYELIMFTFEVELQKTFINLRARLGI
jgi:hypothetical protein